MRIFRATHAANHGIYVDSLDSFHEGTPLSLAIALMTRFF